MYKEYGSTLNQEEGKLIKGQEKEKETIMMMGTSYI